MLAAGVVQAITRQPGIREVQAAAALEAEQETALLAQQIPAVAVAREGLQLEELAVPVSSSSKCLTPLAQYFLAA